MNLTHAVQEAFRAEMAAQGVSVRDLADRLGVARTSVYQYFRPNGSLTLATVGRIAEALGKRVVYRLEAPCGE